MPRKKKERCIQCAPSCILFKPVLVPAKSFEITIVHMDEYEAMRLTDIEKLTMNKACKKMKISAATFCRILASAHTKVADALINVKGIKICSEE